MKSRALSRSAFDVDNPAIVIADALDDGQADTQTFTLCRTPEETLVQERKVKGFNPYAGIGDRETALAEIYADKTAFGILDGIAKQIHKRGVQRLPIQCQDRFRLYRNLEIEALAIYFGTHGFHRLIDAFSEGDRLHDTQCLLASEKKQRLQLLTHPRRCPFDHPDANARPFRKIALRRQKLAARQYCRDWRAQFMADVSGKFLFTPKHTGNAVLVVIQRMRKLRHFLVLARLNHCCALPIARREMPYALGKIGNLFDKHPRKQVSHHKRNTNHREERQNDEKPELLLALIVEPHFIGNKKFNAIDVPDRDSDFLGTPEYLMAPVVEPLEIGRQLGLLGRIMNDIFFEVGAYLRDKVMTVAIALEQIIHLRLHDLLDMRLFDVIRGDIQANAEGSNDNDAENRERQRNAEAKTALKPGHEKSDDNQAHELSRSDHSRQPGLMHGAIRACGCAMYRWCLAHLPRLPIRVPCG